MICLDTNVVIAFLNGRPPHLVKRVDHEMLHSSCALSVITLFELQYGIAKNTRRE